jgi:glycerate 2-kinase
MLALLISDVPGDDPGDIASGPTVGHLGDAVRALDALRHWGVTPGVDWRIPTGRRRSRASG